MSLEDYKQFLGDRHISDLTEDEFDAFCAKCEAWRDREETKRLARLVMSPSEREAQKKRTM